MVEKVSANRYGWVMERRNREYLPTVLGVFALVAVYAVVNDQFIAAIAPTHFTVYHPHYFPFDQAWAQALCFAFVATTGPGLVWGMLLYWAGRFGRAPVIGRRVLVLGAGMVILMTTAAAWGEGWKVAHTGITPYPKFFYPVEDDGLNVTQTVQLTNYLIGAAGAFVWLFLVWAWRIWHSPPAEPAK